MQKFSPRARACAPTHNYYSIVHTLQLAGVARLNIITVIMSRLMYIDEPESNRKICIYYCHYIEIVHYCYYYYACTYARIRTTVIGDR